MKAFVSILLMGVALVRAVAGATFSDSFSSEPRDWKVWNAGAFRWDAQAQNLAVTWDSRETNAFYYFKLPMTLTRRDSFAMEFTVRIDDLAVGANPGKNSTFPICVGFLNLGEAMRPNYFRGSGVNATTGPRSIAEFIYFPDSGFGATVGTVMVSTNNQFAYSHTFPVELAIGETYRVKVTFDADTQVLSTSILHNGEPYGEAPSNTVRPLNYPESFGDFRLDVFSITTYSDAGQTPVQFAGSVLAHGVVDDVVITWPDPPIENLRGHFENDDWVVELNGEEEWSYLLERTTDFVDWETVATSAGSGAVRLVDENPVNGHGFYRVVAERL